MISYLSAIGDVMYLGELKEQRAVTVGGKPLWTKSIFGLSMIFRNIGKKFPIVTTKYVNFRHIVEELLWFLRGETNVRSLQEKGVNIWNEWADKDGELGPIYGKQWRRWAGSKGQQIDQIENLVNGIYEVIKNPRTSAGRRLILSAWNPGDMPDKAPPACHTLSQFNVSNGKLSCIMYQRSADMFLGVPYNITCYATLICLLAKMTGLEPGDFIHNIGDAHIYENHFSQVEEQQKREWFPLPKLVIADSAKVTVCGIDKLHSGMFTLTGYNHHPALRGEIAI